ncbi:MAG: Ig-like domain-containing protein [archaeon]|nr:Ig-like domain-containing protein [archaeon]
MKNKILIILILIFLANNSLALNELTADSSTTFLAHYNNSLNATNNSGASITPVQSGSGITYNAGKIGQGIYINENVNDILTYSSSNLNWDEGTLEFWFNPLDWNPAEINCTTNCLHMFFEMDNASISNYLTFGRFYSAQYPGYIFSGAGKVNASPPPPEQGCSGFWEANTINQGTIVAEPNVSRSWTQGSWHHLAIVWKHNNPSKIKIFADGILVASISASVVCPQTLPLPDFRIGARAFNTWNIGGMIDELRLSNIERSQPQIAEDAGIIQDGTSPTVSITFPSNNSLIAGTTSIAADALDIIGPSGIASGIAGVQFKLDGANIGSEDTILPFEISWDSTTATNGSHIITAVARDIAGNTGTSSAITITVDNSPPVIAIELPTSAPNYETAITPIAVSGTAIDTGIITQVTWTNLAGGSGTTIGTNNWSIPVIDLIPGTNEIIVTALDDAGNSSTDTITVIYNNSDFTPPIVSITIPASNPFTAASSPITIEGTAEDPETGITQVLWENSLGGNGIASFNPADNSFSIPNMPLYSGLQDITITAINGASTFGQSIIAITYDAPPAGNDLVQLDNVIIEPKIARKSDGISVTAIVKNMSPIPLDVQVTIKERNNALTTLITETIALAPRGLPGSEASFLAVYNLQDESVISNESYIVEAEAMVVGGAIEPEKNISNNWDSAVLTVTEEPAQPTAVDEIPIAFVPIILVIVLGIILSKKQKMQV